MPCVTILQIESHFNFNVILSIVTHTTYGLATPERKQKPFHSRNRGKMDSVPNFQQCLVWQVNWKYYELNKAMLLSRSFLRLVWLEHYGN